ncbi:DUF4783 domain-containing protein [Ferruginibacter albus]|uniref:DUF4783 domain-containing protein n=1 Tax=Ferruginibacter albus TaxID=2875540 RepID=UPI001CC42EF6|nr:DUF4783 domain-containing protein [Ferruginibacter albus]UAY51696.1 DUF4783 domain-containing protein [Ferruginibacter albus]
MAHFFNKIGTLFAKGRAAMAKRMKKFTLLLPIIILFSSFVSLTSIDDIVVALNTGNVSKLTKYFDTNIELCTPEKSNNYSKSQAELVLKDFFSNNNVKSFAIIHKGENAGSQYCIGMLQTSTGVYRTTVFMKLRGGSQYLQELRFENR